MRRRDRRAMARAELAAELDRLAGEYRALDLDLGFVRVRGRAFDSALDVVLDVVLELDVVLNRDLALVRDLDRDRAGGLDPDSDVLLNSTYASALMRCFEGAASVLRDDHQQSSLPRCDDGVEGRALSWLARPLPAAERSRFVAEERGNLAERVHWWERVDHLVCLALGTPRLAWMMRRTGQRRRA